MKRLICLLAALLAALALCAPAAAEAAPQQVTICCRGEINAVDLVYTVPAGAEIKSVRFPEGASGEWNYIAEKNRLRISIASAAPLALAAPIAEIDAGGAELTLQKILINGQRWEAPVLTHTPRTLPGKEPTHDEPGLTGGTVCAVCGAVLKAQEEIPALGPELRVSLTGGVLRVQGALSDAQSVEGRLLVAVYAENGQMLTCCDISSQNPGALDLIIPDCADAARVKLLRLNRNWTPSHPAVEAAVP